ncbi:MAG: alpha/beta hydrolase [Oscillospiraceae bacterium]|jgi:acetyl esterase/lipase|nr:alpha/beta hydrolase [Oscillospiraceae bacterium]
MPYVKLKMPDPNSPMAAGGFAMPTLDVDHIKRKWLDVDYTPSNPHPSRKLDIYLPDEGEGPFPTIISIHGGAFWGGSKDDMQVAAYMEAIPYGFAVVSVEQRLCNNLAAFGEPSNYNPEGLFPNAVYDYKAAIRFLRANAAAYKLDPGKFATAGGSAGGYHSVIAAASADAEVLYDNSLGYADVSGEVQAVVDWFGVGDLVLQSEFTENSPGMEFNGVTMKMDNYADIFLGVNAREHPELAYFANPESWITSKMPPTLVQVGAADEIVPYLCSKHIADKIAAVCGPERVTYEEFEGYTHGDMRFNEESNILHMIDWLKKTLC